MKTMLMLLALALAGCAAVDQAITLYAPSRICIGGSDIGCAQLQPTLDELHSTTKALCDAGADTPECKK